MRILLVYDPQNSLPESSARLISELLRREGFELDVADISKKSADILAPYDAVILGGVVWFGKVSKGLAEYIKRNEHELSLKPAYIYLHAYVGDSIFQKQVAQNIPISILEHAYTTNLGLKVNFSLLNPFEKIRWRLANQRVEVEDSIESAKSLVDIIVGDSRDWPASRDSRL